MDTVFLELLVRTAVDLKTHAVEISETSKDPYVGGQAAAYLDTAKLLYGLAKRLKDMRLEQLKSEMKTLEGLFP